MKKDKLTLKTNLLREIFNLAPKRFREENLDNHYLAKKFRISGKELKDNIDFFVETGLINRWVNHQENRIFEWIITDKGLHYLEGKEAEKNQERSNRVIAFTGGIIALTTIYAFIVQSVNLENYPQTYWIITPIFLILVLMCLGPLIKFIVDYWKIEVFGK
jgi:DNA-binding MarR family transcriptional regulator